MFLKNGSMNRRLAFLRWLQLGAVRQLRRYYQDAMTSCRSSHRTPLPSCSGTSVALVAFAPWRTSAPPRPGVGHPVSPAGNLRGANRVLPSSWGTTIVRLHMFQSDAGRTACTRPYGAAAWPLVIERQRLPQWVFRRPIARLSDSLSTLRRADYSNTAQDSLPVAGQALPSGLSTRKIPMRGFKIAFLHLYPPFPSLAWRNRCDRRASDGAP